MPLVVGMAAVVVQATAEHLLGSAVLEVPLAAEEAVEVMATEMAKAVRAHAVKSGYGLTEI